MNNRTFKKPIESIVGLGFIKPIRTVEEAYTFLMEWRGVRGSDNKHSIALKTVKAALAGDVDADTVRPFVEAFAKAVGVLAPDMDGVIAHTSSVETLEQAPALASGRQSCLPGSGS